MSLLLFRHVSIVIQSFSIFIFILELIMTADAGVHPRSWEAENVNGADESHFHHLTSSRCWDQNKVRSRWGARGAEQRLQAHAVGRGEAEGGHGGRGAAWMRHPPARRARHKAVLNRYVLI